MAGQDSNTSKFIAGDVALDFANSVHGWDGATPRGDHLASYDDLLAWSAAAGLLTPKEIRQLAAEAVRTPREAARVLARAVAIRGRVHSLFVAMAAGDRPAPADLQALNAALCEILPHRRLVSTGDGVAWQWDDTPALDRMLWPVLWAAVDLLTSGWLNRVRECGGERCGWLFLDETKNRSRRWCEMSVCGNRAKARRHYDRRSGRVAAKA
jgi:predicted RNA-binding Zn ribbon-like protein